MNSHLPSKCLDAKSGSGASLFSPSPREMQLTAEVPLDLNEYVAMEIFRGGDTTTEIYLAASHSAPKTRFRSSWSYRVAKRIFDLSFALALSPFVFAVGLLLMLLIKCTSDGPVIYRHLRIGQDGREFHLYKFRTMFVHGDTLLRDYLATTPEAQKEWDEYYKLQWDPRVTALGAVLRRTSLDELPQIFNVLLGQMSFVGPRPIVRDEIRRYGAAFPLYTAVKPGITGLWQVSGRGKLPYDARVSLDIIYVTTWSFLQDLRLLLRTAPAVCNLDDAY
jgi:exopolysaccharide production protein ExoY